MIDKGNNLEMNRLEAVKLAIEVLRAQPTGISGHLAGGKAAARYITDMADVFIDYLTGKPSQPEK